MHCVACSSPPPCTNTMVVIFKEQVTDVMVYSPYMVRQLDTVTKVDRSTVDPFSLTDICISVH